MNRGMSIKKAAIDAAHIMRGLLRPIQATATTIGDGEVVGLATVALPTTMAIIHVHGIVEVLTGNKFEGDKGAGGQKREM